MYISEDIYIYFMSISEELMILIYIYISEEIYFIELRYKRLSRFKSDSINFPLLLIETESIK